MIFKVYERQFSFILLQGALGKGHGWCILLHMDTSHEYLPLVLVAISDAQV